MAIKSKISFSGDFGRIVPEVNRVIDTLNDILAEFHADGRLVLENRAVFANISFTSPCKLPYDKVEAIKAQALKDAQATWPSLDVRLESFVGTPVPDLKPVPQPEPARA